jgi:hypothetical protein
MRKHRADEKRVALQRRKDERAELARERRALVDLQVALQPRRLIPGGDASVDPGRARRVEPRAQRAHLTGVQHLRNPDQHA